MKKAFLVLAVWSTYILVGCTALGLTTPQTTDQKLAYADAGVIAALSSIATATNAGQLTKAQATNANNMALAVQATINQARAEESSNASQAIVDLNLATTALTAVQNWLTANGVKSP
jgi:predicted RNA-binding protein associated with RNAse of E/G family